MGEIREGRNVQQRIELDPAAKDSAIRAHKPIQFSCVRLVHAVIRDTSRAPSLADFGHDGAMNDKAKSNAKSPTGVMQGSESDLRGRAESSPDGRPAIERIESVDTLRGLTILLMVFVNDLGPGAPSWMLHIQPPDADGMTLADLVFPAFLFIVGISIPLAIERELSKGGSRRKIFLHIVTRTLGLLTMGLIGVNRSAETTIGGDLWGVLAYVSIILAWCAVPKQQGTRRRVLLGLKGIGILGLLTALAIFRSEPVSTDVLFVGEVQGWTWMRTQWWGILGLIGWAYLCAATVYLLVGRRREWLMGVMMLMFVSYLVFSNGGFFTRVDDRAWLQPLLPCFDAVESFLELVGSYVDLRSLPGSLAGIVVAGSLLGTTLAGPLIISGHGERMRWGIVFAFGLFVAGVAFDSFAGINKIAATPTWCLWSAGVTCVIWVIVYRVMDVGGYKKWSMIARPAGANPLIAYLLHPIVVLTLSTMGVSGQVTGYRDSPDLATVVLGSIVMALMVCSLTGLIAKAGLRVRI